MGRPKQIKTGRTFSAWTSMSATPNSGFVSNLLNAQLINRTELGGERPTTLAQGILGPHIFVQSAKKHPSFAQLAGRKVGYMGYIIMFFGYVVI